MNAADDREEPARSPLASRRGAAELVAVATEVGPPRHGQRFAREQVRRGSRAEIEDLVTSHRPLADRLAAQLAHRGQPLEDLRQVAYMGLVSAAQRYDPSRGVQFATFARATVVGELKKHFRDHAWHVRVPRPVQEMYLAVRAAVEDLTQQRGRAPTPAELAAHLGVDIEDVVEAIDAASALHIDSLDRPPLGEEDRSFDRGDLDPGFAHVDDRSWLVPALAGLPPRERYILELRFVDGLPQSAIAAEVGLSQMHVSRLLAKSLAILRAAAPVA